MTQLEAVQVLRLAEAEGYFGDLCRLPPSHPLCYTQARRDRLLELGEELLCGAYPLRINAYWRGLTAEEHDRFVEWRSKKLGIARPTGLFAHLASPAERRYMAPISIYQMDLVLK